MEQEMTNELNVTVERLAAATEMLQQAAERLSAREQSFAIEAEATLSRVVATSDAHREADLEQRIAAAEAKIADLLASAPTSVTNTGRKTLPAATATLLAKQGVTVDSLEAGALDSALSSLSLEQRIAVKAQLMRAGVLS